MKSILNKLKLLAAVVVGLLVAYFPIAMIAKATAKTWEYMQDLTVPKTGSAFYANTLTGLIPTIYEALDVVGRELVGVIPGTTLDSQASRAAVNQTVSSPVAPSSSASDITPGVTAPNDGDQTIGTMNITISKARAVPIRWNGEEARGVNTGAGVNTIFRDQVTQAIRTLVNEIETDVLTEIRKGASRAYGTAGTTPFGTVNDLTDSSEALRIIEENGAQGLERSLVLSTSAMSNIRGKQAVLFRVNEAGTDLLLRQGILGDLHGSQVRQSAASKLVTKGTGTSYTTSGTALAIGVTAIPLITGTGTVLAGDVVTFAGDTNKYVVAAGVAAPGTITLAAPGLRVAIPASATAMTIGNNFTPSLLFAKSSIVLATRAPALPKDASGREADMADDRMMITDPLTGLNFELSLYRQYRQIRYELAMAWGQKLVKQEHAAILLG
nr:P22 phage major capsid protein family protein [uncultured Undibacterium sp.]